YGMRMEAEAITEGLLRAAYADPEWRLPELYCGYELTGSEHEKPVAYPVSCSPQAWASGAFPLIVRSMLGLHVDPETRSLRVEPQLPDWIDTVEMAGIRALGVTGDVQVVRTAGGMSISVGELSLVGS
ncbi:MAG: glycogen debranching N-terminal domain-containing protein, partial [Thermomicrobiales bacterium]